MDLNKMREDRAAREKARIQKLRELNLLKYAKKGLQANYSSQPQNFAKKVKPASANQAKSTVTKNVFHTGTYKNVKNNFHVNGTTKRPITAPNTVPTKVASALSNMTQGKLNVLKTSGNKEGKAVASTSNTASKIDKKEMLKSTVSNVDGKVAAVKSGGAKISAPNTKTNNKKSSAFSDKPSTSTINGKSDSKTNITSQNQETDPTKAKKSSIPTKPIEKVLIDITKKETINPKMFIKTSRQSLAHKSIEKPKTSARKTMLPTLSESSKSESVFDRLYKPKYINKKTENEVEKLKSDPNFLKKIITSSGLITNKRHTCFETRKEDVKLAPRRSISAVHLKRISKNEIANCIHKWASIGDNLNKVDLEANEDDKVKGDKFVSAIKSERKKVKFFTPVPSNFNTPRLDELQSRLISWLRKRGKSLESYHHLQCFGVNHLENRLETPKHITFADGDGTPAQAKNDFKDAKNNFDEENKENIALDSDSDDGSFLDTMNEPEETTLCPSNKIDIENWRNVSMDTESVGFNESTNFNETTVTSADTLANMDELLLGALNDLTTLLREGFDWQQSARWLRTIRDRFPHAPRTAAYWECRAALEDSRGDLPASVQCWEEAIAKGTEHSVVESNLDQLLDKFMQLKISPQSGAKREPDPKLVDVKNVFKSTIIRFAVQKAKLRHQTEQFTFATPVYTVTPVRRSGRLSHSAVRTPRQICTSVRHAASIAPQHIFTPNKNIATTP